jgi:tRNA pseudouridine55 synthase
VRELTVIDYEPPVATLSVRCGSGTYVRSLARDLARAVGSVGHLESLRRTGIAGFEVDESVHPDEFVPEMDLWPPRKVATALPGVGTAVLRPEAVRRVAHGAPLQSEDFLEPPGGEDITLATTEDGEVAAAIQRRGPGFKYVFVAARQEETA